VTRRVPGGPAPAGGVRPQLRQPGTVLGPRAERTIAKILDSTRQIFLTKGYAGTTVEEIMRVAGVSRGSFYTYFPSKRDVLLALGADSARAGLRIVAQLDALAGGWTIDDLEAWTIGYLDVLDEHGSFAIAWTQAAQEDEEIRQAGMMGHLPICRRLGVALGALGTAPSPEPTELGLAVFAMLERAWAYSQLYEGTVTRAALARTTARTIAALEHAP